MSLEATHIRFALDLKERFGVKDLNKYLSGAIYPDSRYITKIDRKLTHSDDVLNENFYKDDDFKKGWAVHFLCDKLSRHIVGKNFPEFFIDVNNKNEWIPRTAIKILQDILDASIMDVKKYTKYLNYTNTPNGENPEMISKYYKIFRNAYQTDSLNEEDEYNIWTKFGLDPEMLEKVKAKVAEFKNNESVMDRITKIYDEMIDQYK